MWENNKKVFFVFEHVAHAVHVQHAQNMTTCIKITEVQNTY